MCSFSSTDRTGENDRWHVSGGGDLYQSFLDNKPCRPLSLYVLPPEERVYLQTYLRQCIYKLETVWWHFQVTSLVGKQKLAAAVLQVTLSIRLWNTAFASIIRFAILSFSLSSSFYLRVRLKLLVNMAKSGTCTSVINLRYQDGSEGSPSNPAKFNNQDYAQLKDNYLRKGKLFVDSTFPPDNQSLGDLPDLSSWREAQVMWLRPAVKYF